VYTELTFFSTQIENLLVAQRIADDQYAGINAGSSSHPGIEFMMNYKLLNSSSLQVTPYFSAALNNFKFKDFVDRGNDYSGNELTGVPDKQWTLGLDFYAKKGLSINVSFLNVGKIPMNDSNTKYSDAYSLLDIKTSYLFTILKVLKTELNAGINNALGEKYAASILPNAVGFGAVQPRYYYPGNPINYYGGFSVSYVF
jgi:iron complex outermembrane recepter protein